jgi:4'-phosphopantetheinyl transferase
MGLSAITKDAWFAAPDSLPLPLWEMHLWRADAMSFAANECMLTDMLSEAELKKANSFRKRVDRNRSILARAVLRDILGRYMDIEPRHVQFLDTGSGKPLLNPDAHANAPHFSVSHSGSIILLVFAREHHVGVDVEEIRQDLDVIDIAQRFFAPSEVDDLLELPVISRVRAFFAAWTRKEAYLKARAEGIGSGMNQFAVTLAPGEPARLINDDRHPEEVTLWRLHDIPLGSVYAAATAVHSRVLYARYWTW